MENNNEKKTKISWFRSLLTMLFGERVGGKMSLHEEEQVQSPMRTIIREFFRRKLTIIGLVAFFTMLIASTIIPIFFPLDIRIDIGQRDQPPSMNMMRIPRNIRGDIATLDAGPGFGVGVTNAGDIYVWGTANTGVADLLVPPTPAGNVVHVSAGNYHALALTDDGRVYSWGHHNPFWNIHEIPEEYQGTIQAVVAGQRKSIAVTTDGQLRFWGAEHDLVRPSRARAVFNNALRDGASVVKLDANWFTAGMLTDAGTVHILLSRVDEREISIVPEEIQGHIIDFAMADDHVGAVLDDGTVVVWGMLGGYLFDIPEEVQGNAVSIGAGREHFTVLLNDGSVVSWGENFHGRTSAPNISDGVAIFIAADHNYVLHADGSITTWGLRGFIFGTDHLGRCVWTRLWHGGRYTLLIGMVAVIVQGIIGLLFGGLSGYYGGKVDMFLMRLAEVVGSLPFLPLALILQFRFRDTFGPVGGMMFLMAVFGILSWPGLMRLVRAQIMQARESEYVLAARALGVRQFKLIFRHIMPNVASAAIVLLTLALATSMLTETTLSFIGFGVAEPTPTWGNMLTGANNAIVLRQQWWRVLFPAVALVTVAISINLIGDGLREATDPRSQGR